MLLVKSELYLSKDWLDTDGVGAADATRETFGNWICSSTSRRSRRQYAASSSKTGR